MLKNILKKRKTVRVPSYLHSWCMLFGSSRLLCRSSVDVDVYISVSVLDLVHGAGTS